MQKVAIAGIGQTKTKLKRRDVRFPELMGEACDLALEDAGFGEEDVECTVLGSGPEFFEGISEPEHWCADYTGGVRGSHFRIQTGGTVGAATTSAGYYMVASGMFDAVLVVSGDKLSESSVQQGLSLVYSPTMGRDFAGGAPSAVANQTRIYMSHYPEVSEKHFAKIGTMMRKNALKNPNAQLHLKNISEEMMLGMNWLSSPLRLLDACPTSDAACAMLLLSERLAEKLNRPLAWIQAVATISDGVNYPDRDWGNPVALKEAAERCYRAVGITDPLEQLDVMELYDAFSSQHLFWYDALGLCEPGQSYRLIEEGVTAMDGKLPVNPSGGVLSNNSIGASAILRQAEVALQVMGRAGERQVPDARIGLAQGWGGAIQFHAVMILSKDKDVSHLRKPAKADASPTSEGKA